MKLTDHENGIEVYNNGTINAKTVTSIHNVLLCMNLKISQCRGKRCDGALNIAGSKHGVAAELLAWEPLALHLVDGNAVKQSIQCQIPILHDCYSTSDGALETAGFQRSALGDPTAIPGTRWCPTR